MVPSTRAPGTRLGLVSLWLVSICINLFALPSGTSCPFPLVGRPSCFYIPAAEGGVPGSDTVTLILSFCP